MKTKPKKVTVGELKKLARDSERMLKTEASKPQGERDDELIDECAENMLYCESSIAELRREKAARTSRSLKLLPRTSLGRVAATVLIALGAFALGAAVVSAAVKAPWASKVDEEKDSLTIQFGAADHFGDPEKNDESGEPAAHSGMIAYDPERLGAEFDSEDALRDYLGDAFLYPYGLEGFEMNRAVVKWIDGFAPDFVEVYGASYNGIPLDFYASIGNENIPPESLSELTSRPGHYTDIVKKSMYGADCVFAHKEGESWLCFTYRQNVYTIAGDVDYGTLETILAAMLNNQ